MDTGEYLQYSLLAGLISAKMEPPAMLYKRNKFRPLNQLVDKLLPMINPVIFRPRTLRRDRRIK